MASRFNLLKPISSTCYVESSWEFFSDIRAWLLGASSKKLTFLMAEFIKALCFMESLELKLDFIGVIRSFCECFECCDTRSITLSSGEVMPLNPSYIGIVFSVACSETFAASLSDLGELEEITLSSSSPSQSFCES